MGARTTLDADTDASYTVTVTATDPAGGDEGTATQDVTITVKNLNEAPMISEGFTRISQSEYDDGTAGEAATITAAVATAKVVDTYMATDPEITVVPISVTMASCTWSVSGTDAGDFEISNEDGTFGALTFKETPNYEMPADSNSDNVYNVMVVATDKGVATMVDGVDVFDEKNKMTATRDVVITVKNVEEDGTVSPVGAAAEGWGYVDGQRHRS